MRVVAGSARGARLRAPAGRCTRPTSDRVKEAMFSMLNSLGAIEGAAVVDLFAGSGSLGIEALSRGAASVVFVDRDPRAIDALLANLAAAGIVGSTGTVGPTQRGTGLASDGRARVLRGDSLRYASSAPPADIALLDPPYAYADWPVLLERIGSFASLVVIETASGPEVPAALDRLPGWEVLRTKSYGSTLVMLVRPAAERAPANAEEMRTP